MSRRPLTYNVAPRWSAGSPAQVGEQTAREVVRDERAAHERALEGAYGPERAARAADLPYALRGIVEQRHEHADGWLVIDLLTHEVCYRFFERRDRRPPTRAQHARARALVLALDRERLAAGVAVLVSADEMGGAR